MQTTNSPITIAPSKTALVIIDMQNFFLSSALGRKREEGHVAEENLLKHGIPAARKAGIQIIWLTWGITEEGLRTMPPTVYRIFGWEIADSGQFEVENDGGAYRAGTSSTDKAIAEVKTLKRKERKSDPGLGAALGDVKLQDGTVVNAGRMLMRDQWNTALHEPLEAAFKEGLKAKVPDVRFYKERLSGLWSHSNECQSFLAERGITTLLFTGVNTDQCVLASLQDACNKSWDTILLKDGCGTTSPEYTKKMVEFNCEKSWGFVSSCEELSKGVNNIVYGETNGRGNQASWRDEL